MRDKPPAPHVKHILSEREEHFHESTAAASSRRAAAQKQDYDITAELDGGSEIGVPPGRNSSRAESPGILDLLTRLSAFPLGI